MKTECRLWNKNTENSLMLPRSDLVLPNVTATLLFVLYQRGNSVCLGYAQSVSRVRQIRPTRLLTLLRSIQSWLIVSRGFWWDSCKCWNETITSRSLILKSYYCVSSLFFFFSFSFLFTFTIQSFTFRHSYSLNNKSENRYNCEHNYVLNNTQ